MSVLRPLWTEVTDWLSANAPGTLDDLRLPAGPARLREAEEEIGFSMPAELAEWWQLHDGTDTEASSLLPGYYMHGVSEMLNDWRIWRDVGLEVYLDQVQPEDSPEAGGPAYAFRPDFLPIGGDGAGNNIFVDCRPGARHACLMDYDHEAGALQPPLYASLADLLTQVSHAFRTGEPVRHRTPVVSEGRLSWDFA
ncbi:hypothetical protein GCM10022251_27310 [Phytohabitans flavus]|uniref:Knr4/Smi1-like domain-containing protein n=1 Tax=Phytohabitans flavus TaxID=1076124 RepID=A0A6F8XPI8_9ACTN|nr:SMI1/KNR4 family protein [Phytohabitans flavus]BCB75661.1 hypothetical protein Pflav_020710 [Phytohabitans flavus]